MCEVTVLKIEPRAYGLVLASTELNTQTGVCVLFTTNEVLWTKRSAEEDVGDSVFEK